MADIHPPASEVRRQVFRNDSQGIQVPAGWETVRSAACPEHHKRTDVFIGVNGYGWVFRCRGDAARGEEPRPHAFIARPCAPAVTLAGFE